MSIANISQTNAMGLAEVQAAHQLIGQQVQGLESRLQAVETHSGQLVEFQRGHPSGELHQMVGGVDQRLQIVERTCRELVGGNQVQTARSDQSARVRSMEQQISVWDHKWSEVVALQMQQVEFQENLGRIKRVEQQVSMLPTQQSTSTDMLNEWSGRLVDCTDAQMQYKTELTAIEQHF